MNVNEKLFKISADHLIRQGRKCECYAYVCDELRNELLTNNCVYRNHRGFRDAVGALISDEQYKYSLEDCPASSNCVKNAIADSHNIKVDEINDIMILRLQEVHDHTEPGEWSQKLTDLADQLGFHWTPPEVPV
jgi:hypothetical protein